MASPARRSADGAAEFVDKLNKEYNLGIHIVPLSLSPRKRKEALTTEDEHVAERIHSLVRRLGFRPNALPEIDEQFNQEARRVCSRWVRKPRATPNVIPVTDASPRASTAEERRQLRECLLEILLDHSPNSGSRRLEDRKEPSGERLLTSSLYVPSPNTSPSKRARSALDKVPVATSSGPRNESPIPANPSFKFNGGLAVAHPPSHHSLSGAPTTNHSVDSQAIAHRPLQQTFSGPAVPAHFAGLHESASFSPRRGAPAAASHSCDLDGQGIRGQVPANTSMMTRHSAVFSFPPPDDNDGSQSTVPNDDCEEYNEAHFAVYVPSDGPETPTRSRDSQAAAAGDSDSSLGFFTPSEEAAMIALDSTISKQRRVRAASALMQDEVPDDTEFPQATSRRLFQNVARENEEAEVTIRQRANNPPVSSTAATWSTTCNVEVNERRPIIGDRPVADEPLFSTPLSLEDRLRNSWRE